jgi:hypothetical protein
MQRNLNNDMPNEITGADSFNKIGLINEQIRLIKERGLHTYLNRDINKFEEYFARLQELLDLSATNYRFEEAYELFYKIFDAVPLIYHRLSDIPIFRGARNKIGEIFTSQSRISYNKNLAQIGPGKFNVWYQPMFYGCLPYRPQIEKEYPEPRLVAALECCKDLFQNENGLLVQDITVGKWLIREPFDAINLCFDSVHLIKNPELKEVNDRFRKHMLDTFSPQGSKFIMKIFEFFSTLCRTSSDAQAYYVLTALFTAIKTYHQVETNLNVDALISPSAASEGHGLNIVMFPETVDRCLYLDAVIMDRYFLVMPEARNYSVYPCSDVVQNHKRILDFDYLFKNYLPLSPDFIKRNYICDYSDGGDFKQLRPHFV